jgi:hypothetical protein
MYVESGHCKFGDACRYKHEQPRGQAHRVQRGGAHGARAGAGGFGQAHEARVHAPRGQCDDYFNTGACRFGDSCRYSHDELAAGVRTVADSSSSSSGPTFSVLVRRECRSLAERIALIQSALAESDVDAVILAWADPKRDFLNQLEDVLRHLPCGVTATEHFSFQRLLLPTLMLLAQNGFTNSAHEAHRGRFYTCMRDAATTVFPRLLACVERMSSTGRLVNEDPGGASVSISPRSIDEVVFPLASVLYALCKVFTNFAAQECVLQWSLRLEEVLLLCHASDTARAARPLRYICELVQANAQYDTKMTATLAAHEKQKQEVARGGVSSLLMRQRSFSGHFSAVDLPGDLRDSGMRHANDHAEFRKITILPGASEVLSTHAPFLPVWPPNIKAAEVYAPRPTDAYLDAQVSQHADSARIEG